MMQASLGITLLLSSLAALIVEPVVRHYFPETIALSLKRVAGFLLGLWVFMLFLGPARSLISWAGDGFTTDHHLRYELEAFLLGMMCAYTIYLLFRKPEKAPRYRLSQFHWGPSIAGCAFFLIFGTLHITSLPLELREAFNSARPDASSLLTEEPFISFPWLGGVFFCLSIFAAVVGSFLVLRRCHIRLAAGEPYETPLIQLFLVQLLATVIWSLSGVAAEALVAVSGAIFWLSISVHGLLLLRRVDWDGTLQETAPKHPPTLVSDISSDHPALEAS